MRRILMLALPLLAACSTTPAVSPTLPDPLAAEPLPPLRTAFLGETLRLQGQLSVQLPDRMRNENFALVLEVPGETSPHQVVGMLRTNGAFDVEAASAPTPTEKPEQAFSRLPLNSGGGQSWCNPETLEVSDTAARLFVAKQLGLRYISNTAARPLLSPAYPSAGLLRSSSTQKQNVWMQVHLVYADRDVLVRGQKACRYQLWSGGLYNELALFEIAANLDLRRGWNEVRVAEWVEYPKNLNLTRRVVSGNDPATTSAWAYNNGAMFNTPVTLP